MSVLIFDSIDGTFGGTARPVSPFTKCVTAYQQFITSPQPDTALAVNPKGLGEFLAEAKSAGGILSLDIETWPINWSILQASLGAARAADPALRISFFGSGVVTGTMIEQGLAGAPSAFAAAQAIDDSQDAITTMAMCDFCQPGLYLNSTQTMANFLAMAGYTVAQSRRYRKPVYAEVCPFYGDNGVLMPEADWSNIIWSLGGIADGLVIWAHIDSAWDESAAWWQALKVMG